MHDTSVHDHSVSSIMDHTRHNVNILKILREVMPVAEDGRFSKQENQYSRRWGHLRRPS